LLYFNYPSTPCVLPSLGLTTLLSLGLCAYYLSCAQRQRLALSLSSSFECFASSYARPRGPLIASLDLPVLLLAVLPLCGFLPQMALVGNKWNIDALIGDASHGLVVVSRIPLNALQVHVIQSYLEFL
jgi:hypothetical protein